MDWDTFNDIGETFPFPLEVSINTVETTKEITSEEEKNILVVK